MSRLTVLLFIILISFTGCSSDKNVTSKDRDLIKISVSILPQAFIVKSIGGEHVTVNVMTPPASSPETYEPGPKRMAELKDSDIYFLIGMPFENTSIEKVRTEYKNVKFIDMHKDIILQNMEKHSGHDHPEAESFAGEIKDPHIWLDPLLLIVMAQNTVNELIKIDPENRDSYIDNHIKLKKELQILNDELVDMFKDSFRKSFIIYHPAWGYFANRYGIRQVPVEIEGKEPSASEMAELIDLTKKNKAKYLFIQAQSPDSIIRSVATETGAEIQFLDPLKENVIENIRESAKIIKKGLFYAKKHY